MEIERADRQRNHRFNAKHAILMDAIRGLNKCLSQIVRLATIDIEWRDISLAYSEGWSQVAPVFAVADCPLIEQIQTLSDQVNVRFITLSQKRRPIVALLDISDVAEKSAQAAHAENERYFGMQTEATALGKTGTWQSGGASFFRSPLPICQNYGNGGTRIVPHSRPRRSRSF